MCWQQSPGLMWSMRVEALGAGDDFVAVTLEAGLVYRWQLSRWGWCQPACVFGAELRHTTSIKGGKCIFLVNPAHLYLVTFIMACRSSQIPGDILAWLFACPPASDDLYVFTAVTTRVAHCHHAGRWLLVAGGFFYCRWAAASMTTGS